MSMKDRLGRVTQRAKDVGAQARTLDGIVEMLATEGIAETISASLPPVPGRGWVFSTQGH